MTPEERQVITGIFERLSAAENHPRDPEAEKLIGDLVAQQPYAPYDMAQSIYVNGRLSPICINRCKLSSSSSKKRAKRRKRAKEAQARTQPQSGGFLSSLFGGPSAAPPSRPAPTPPPRFGDARPGYAPQPYGSGGPMPTGPMSGIAPQPGPWGGQGFGGAPQGGGFLQNAMSTAAGVAGGMVLANALTSCLGHHSGLGLGSDVGSGLDPSDRAERPFRAMEVRRPRADRTPPRTLPADASQDRGASWNNSNPDRPVDASYDPSAGWCVPR